MTIKERMEKIISDLDSLESDAYHAKLHGLERIANESQWNLEHYRRECDNEPELSTCKLCFNGNHEHMVFAGETCDCACHRGGRLEAAA